MSMHSSLAWSSAVNWYLRAKYWVAWKRLLCLHAVTMSLLNLHTVGYALLCTPCWYPMSFHGTFCLKRISWSNSKPRVWWSPEWVSGSPKGRIQVWVNACANPWDPRQKTWFYLLSLAPLQATVDKDPQPAIMCFYSGQSRFLSSVSDVGRDTQCKDRIQYCGVGWNHLWSKW